MIKLSDDEIENFISNVRKTRKCWIWMGAFFPESGYGSFYLKCTKNSFGVHRIAFFIANKYLTKGLQVRHNCHNRACVNPKHLLEGTHAQNMQDMVAAGRSLKGDKNPSITHNYRLARGKQNPFHLYKHVQTAVREGHKNWVAKGGQNGSNNPCAKLTENDVISIRSLSAQKKYNYSELAKKFGTSKVNIRQIVLRQKWTHI